MADQTVVFDDGQAPRGQTGSREPTALGRFIEELQGIKAAVEALQRGSQLRNASISGGEGLRILDQDGTLQAQISPDRTVTIFDQTGSPVVRMGDMQETGPLEFGIEVRIGEDWIQLGSQNVTWANVGSLPATYDAATQKWDPRPHQHGGGDITSAVANATTAAQADGVTSAAFNRDVTGTPGTWYAMYMHSNLLVGRNTSSRRYKKYVRPATPAPAPEEYADEELRGLRYQPVIYDRKATGADDYTPAVAVDELGLLAEEVEKINPKLAVYFEGRVDNVRYELVALELIPALRNHERRIAALEKQQAADRTLILEMKQTLDRLTKTPSSTPPPAATESKGTTP